MIKKLIIFCVLIGILVYAGDVVDADRPKPGYGQMKLGFNNGEDFGLDLPDTLASTGDTLFTRWVGDMSGNVNPIMVSVSIDIDQYKTQTGAHNLWMCWANDTTDFVLVDSAKGGAAATFDTTYQEILVGACFYRWYVTAACTCIVNDFRVQVTGYGK
jgi:hypothetical protein